MTFEPFRTVVADPPWKFGDSLPNAKRKIGGKVVYGAGAKRGAAKLYRTMTTRDIKDHLFTGHLLDEELNRRAASDELIAPDALLFLWRVSAMQREALDVMAAWGFEQKSEGVWVKTTTRPVDIAAQFKPEAGYPKNKLSGTVVRLHFGMGHYLRGSHESFLIGRRGRAKVLSRSERSVLFAPAGEHSEKPEAFYELVERLSPPPYLELFARKKRPGWTCIGDEL